MKIDDDLNRYKVPKYIQLKETIKTWIEEGKLKPNTKLSSRNEFKEEYDLSETTIRKAIEELTHEGYIYRIQGKGTFVADKRQTPITIALVIPHLCWGISHAGSDITPRLAQSIEKEAKNSGASIMLYLDNDDAETERINLRDITNRKIDALILFYISDNKNIDCLNELHKSGVPIILIDRVIPDVHMDCVMTDNYIGAYKATKHLIDNGFKKVFHFTYDINWSSVVDRTAGYSDAMNENGLSCNIIKIDGPPLNAASDESYIYDVTKKILSDVHERTAIFALNSPMLVGAWNAISESNIPYNDLALASFDEPYIFIHPDILYIKIIQPLEEIGKRSVKIAIDKLKGDMDIVQVKMQPDIFVMDGSRAIRMMLS